MMDTDKQGEREREGGEGGGGEGEEIGGGVGRPMPRVGSYATARGVLSGMGTSTRVFHLIELSPSKSINLPPRGT